MATQKAISANNFNQSRAATVGYAINNTLAANTTSKTYDGPAQNLPSVAALSGTYNTRWDDVRYYTGDAVT